MVLLAVALAEAEPTHARLDSKLQDQVGGGAQLVTQAGSLFGIATMGDVVGQVGDLVLFLVVGWGLRVYWKARRHV